MDIIRIIRLSLVALAVAALGSAPVLAQKATAPAAKKASSSKKPTARAATRKATSKKAPASRTAKSRLKTKSKKKTASACAGLARTQCTARKECGWITPKKKVSSNGRKLTAYCRKTSRGAKKPSLKKTTAAKKKTN